ncbi:MAG: hypothetical protein RIQ81_271 [Pseudomonadota bacterium]|jgi:hypothetical protein
MFRFFLTKKLFSGESSPVAHTDRPNRRMADRFFFDRRRMTMMSEQDIMVVRDVSTSGFSSIVSERVWSRLNSGDGFASRVRVGQDILEFDIRVAWKDVWDSGSPGGPEHLIGFELVHDRPESAEAWTRLIRPVSLAGTLRRVDSSFMQQYGSTKVWYRGEHGCDLMIWSAPEGGELVAWRLSFDGHYVEWRSGVGFETGISPDQFHSALANASLPRNTGNKVGSGRADVQSRPDRRRLVEALDILSASDLEEANVLTGLLEGELAADGEKRRFDIR